VGLLDKLLGRKPSPSPSPSPPPSTSPQLASISVADPSTLPPGAMAVVGATVNLSGPVSADTTLAAVSANAAALTVETPTVLAGQSSVPLMVNVLEGGAAVQISVSLGAQTLQATIVTG
jgi:hypothetical protein